MGSTGKTVAELEKTIGLMKKCMEKVQSENDRLKKVPAVIASSKMEELQQENSSLKVSEHQLVKTKFIKR